MKQMFLLMAVTFAAMISLNLTAAEGDDGKGPGDHKRPPPGMIIKFVLEHKDALKLTDDQVAKIEALPKPDHKPGEKPTGDKPPGDKPKGDKPQGKGPPPDGKGHPEGKGPGGPLKDILTEDQHEKLKELLKAEHPGGPGEGKGPGKKPQQ